MHAKPLAVRRWSSRSVAGMVSWFRTLTLTRTCQGVDISSTSCYRRAVTPLGSMPAQNTNATMPALCLWMAGTADA